MSSTQTQEMPAAHNNSASSRNTSSNSDSNSLDGIPPLTYRRLNTETEKQDALRLVVDSIAQQRQVASAAIILHPACLSALACMCAIAYRLYAHQGFGPLTTMLAAVGIVYLSTTRYFTAAYIQRAEAFRWKDWIMSDGKEDRNAAAAKGKKKPTTTTKHGGGNARKRNTDVKGQQQQQQQRQNEGEAGGEEDAVLAAVYGEEIIATLVLRFPAAAAGGRRGVIRAWTTKMRYRGKGIGSDMLQFAAQVTRERLGPGAGLEFARDHANSARPLYDVFNGPFRKREERAEKALADVLGKMEAE